MKVCLISSSLYSPPVLSGVEVVVRAELRHLVQRGNQVSVITTSPRHSLSCDEKEGAKVYSFRPLNIFERSNSLRKPLGARLIYHAIDLLWNPQPYKVIRDILATERPEVVHIHNWRGLSPSVFDAVKSVGLPLALHIHDYSLICPNSSLLRSSERFCINQPLPCRLYRQAKKLAVDGKSTIVIGNSQFVVDKLREFGLFRNTQAVRLFNPIELDNRQYMDKDYNAIDILYVGKLIRLKGVQVLINAFKQLKYDNIKLHIAGGGDYAMELKKAASSDPRIIFYGFLPHEKLTPLYQKANIMVVPSIWYEPFGLIIIESFKYGTPVVGSNIGGIPELIEEGYNGRLFEAGNVVELSNTLERLIESPDELKRLSDGAFESAKKYDLNCHVTELLGIYEKAIAINRSH